MISKIRGHVDLIENEQGGLLLDVNDIKGFAVALQRMVDDETFRKKMGEIAKERVMAFDSEIVRERINEIYDDVLKNI